MIAFGQRHGDSRLWAIEGTGSFGAGLTRPCSPGESASSKSTAPSVPLVGRAPRATASTRSRAARQALGGDGVAQPRCRGEREAIRVLLATRAAIEFRTRAIRALHALVTRTPDSLRERFRTLTLGELLRTCGALGARPGSNAASSATSLVSSSASSSPFRGRPSDLDCLP